MPGSVYGNVWSNLGIITDPDFSDIKDNKVIIGKKILPNLYVVTVVTVERRFYIYVLASLS